MRRLRCCPAPCSRTEKLTLSNLPRLADVDSFGHLLNGSASRRRSPVPRRATASIGAMTMHAAVIASTVAPYDIVRKMRASILVLGPAAGACGRGDGVAAGRLRDRQPADRSPPERRSRRWAPRSSWPPAM
jgi:UDP-N-acetylglucosamine enolpyruvyl transferase